ncbi:inversin isoform X4 [Denticeps clupeoides]|nr:inversin isoform X4 [Denticeps clupeoides]
MWAAGKGSDDVLKMMLDMKPNLDINMADKYGGTALHAAALSGHVTTVGVLLERGAAVDPLDVMKHTPLFRACEMGHRDVILTLIKGGARVDLVDIEGHSALHWAALGGNAEVCEVLMLNGLGPNLQDSAGRTPLQCAAYAGYINCMALLLQHDSDPNIQDKEGRTALHWSCNNGYLDAVKLLLDGGTFPNHMESTEERYTPLDYALLGEHQEVTQYLLEHGALSIAAIQDIAASSIQALFKGYRVRRAYRERKNLLMKHEQLRKDAAKKRGEERRREAEQQLSLAGCLERQLSLAEQTCSLHQWGGAKEIIAPKRNTPKTQRSQSQRRPELPNTSPECSSTARAHPPVTTEAQLKRPTSRPVGTVTQSRPQVMERGERVKESERERRRKEVKKRRNAAARTIQRAWRRCRVRARLRVAMTRHHKGAGPAEVTALLIQLLWDLPKPTDLVKVKHGLGALATKNAGKKSSVLQNIYGGLQVRKGRSITAELNTLPELKTTQVLSGMECVRVDSAQARQFSYHMRPESGNNHKQRQPKN